MISEHEAWLVSIGEDGYGKRTRVSKIMAKGRGSLGRRITSSPPIAAAVLVRQRDELVVATSAGKIIRLSVADVPERGPATRGVRLVKVRGTERVTALALAPPEMASKRGQEGTAA
jgi:DNA gyrase subunit A